MRFEKEQQTGIFIVKRWKTFSWIQKLSHIPRNLSARQPKKPLFCEEEVVSVVVENLEKLGNTEYVN